MRSILIPTTSLRVSRIGFGTAGLTALNDRRSAVRLLNAAFDAGVTHYDTARLYGLGHAEAIVGEFLAGKRESVTLASKFGLQPPGGIATNARLVSIAKKLLKRVPAVARRVRSRAQPFVATSAFTAEAAARSLEKSLSELRTDRLDLLMLHECTLADASQDALLGFLEVQLARGTVCEIGIATAAENLQGDARLFPTQYRIVQMQNNVLDDQIARIAGLADRGLITHSALRPLGAIEAVLAGNEALARSWMSEIGIDLRDGTALARLLLGHALAQNPDGSVLFATTRLQRVLPTLTGVDDPALAVAAAKFARLARDLIPLQSSPRSASRPA